MPTDEKMNILLVDDRPENLFALESVLQDLGQNLVQATSGREALKQMLHQEFAVILMDVQMPGMNGYETATLIRDREKTQHTPIIFLTANYKADKHITQGYSVGAIDYVVKPFEPDILKAKVSAFVDLSKKTKELKEEVERRTCAEEEVRKLNDNLERRVAQRTADLQAANRELKTEIAERKRAQRALAEHQTHIEALNARLQQAVTETHHRVKNNLQLIAAMLDMRIMEDTPSIPTEEVRRLVSYVRTLATVHDILTEQSKGEEQAQEINGKEVLDKLLPMLQETAMGRRLHFLLEDIMLSARQSTSLALVVNELVSNALKHSAGSVDVFFRLQEGRAVLTVLDDGPGFPPDFDPMLAANTGLELVDSLSRWDLGGSAVFENRAEGGACVRVFVPIPIPESLASLTL